MTLLHLLPSVSLECRQLLPNQSGVYWVTSHSKVLYVGKAKNLRARWNSKSRPHHKLKKLSEYRHVRIHWQLYPLWAYSHVEAREIRKFKPPLNERYERMHPLLSAFDFACKVIVGLAGLTFTVCLFVALL